MKPQNRLVEFANSSFGFWTCFLGGVGGEGGMTTTLCRTHPEQYRHKCRFTRYLQYLRDVGPFYIGISDTPNNISTP